MTPMDGLWMRWNTAPRWVIIAFIAVTVLAGYWVYQKISDDNTSDNSGTDKQWKNKAISYLTQQGYSQEDASDAVNAYNNGSSLTPTQVSLVAAAIGAVGMPASSIPNSAVTSQVTSQPTSGPWLLGGGSSTAGVNGGTTSSLPGAPYPAASGTTGGSDTAYWTVVVGQAGWSTTFDGISDQFFGNTSQATALQKLNPNLSNTLYGKLPQGSRVKVPR